MSSGSLRQASIRKCPVLTVDSSETVNQRIYMQYLGTLSLLGRVARELPNPHPERAEIERALIDANVILRRMGSNIYFERASGGYAAFDIPGTI